MQLRRWLGLVVLAPSLVVVVIALFSVGDLLGLKDTPAIRWALVGTAVVAFLTGWLLAVPWGVRHAVWAIPPGVGVAMAIWPLVLRPTALSLVELAAVTAVWVGALTAVSLAAVAFARRSAPAAFALAVAGTGLLAIVLPFLAVRLGVGSTFASWSSAATWTLAGLTDEPYLDDITRRHATQIAGMFAFVVATGSAYVLGYVIRHTSMATDKTRA